MPKRNTASDSDERGHPKLRTVSDSDLKTIRESHRLWLETDSEQGQQADLSRCDFRGRELQGFPFDKGCFYGADFTNARLHDSQFSQAVCRRAIFVRAKFIGDPSFARGDFRRANFRLATASSPTKMRSINNAILVGTQGLFGAERLRFRLEFARGSEPIVQRWKHLRVWGDAPSWWHIGFAGRLPFFGLSNVTLIGILAYAAAARWYNRQLVGLVERAENGEVSATLDTLASVLVPAPAPSHLGRMLVALIALTIASVIYSLKCPDCVREYSQTAWEASKDRDPIEYISANYSRLLWRWAAGLLYTGGIGYTALYVVRRVQEAVAFFYG